MPADAPSWTRPTTTSASPFAGSPSWSWAVTRLSASTGSPNSTSAMPDGVTSVGVSSVTTPTKPTSRPSISTTWYSGSAGFVVPLS
ncbi:Uncharacterised protein [Mycobacteroides abscessus]|nr:Uncharacterised protein [Mycobacteroides abscessus]